MKRSNVFSITSTAELKSLKIACILDEFSYETFSPECILQQLTPDAWESELKELSPDLLLVESAWRGKGDLWKHALLSQSSLFVSIIKWCNDREIPTVFWNKEDPVNFENFTYGMGISQLFDYVFTTDIDSISRYKRILDHDRVYLLPFTFQPAMHNPIEQYEREDAVCFAGSYYHKYPRRSRDFAAIYDAVLRSKPMVIYDRNHTRGDPKFQYPEKFHKSIKGFLPFSEISKGYKGYEYGLTLNSVTQSQKMFARRALELIACNTALISNYSRSLRLLFGDAVAMLGDEEKFSQELQQLFQDDGQRRRNKYHLLRHVFAQYTAQRGLQLIVECVSGKRLRTDLEMVCCFATVSTQTDFAAVLRSFTWQEYPQKKLFVLANSELAKQLAPSENVEVVPLELWDEATAKSVLKQYPYVAKFDPRDYYGPLYLSDAMMSQIYAPGVISCREPHYCVVGDKVCLSSNNMPYRWCSKFFAASAVFPSHKLSASELSSMLVHEYFTAAQGEALSLDYYGYLRLGADVQIQLSEVDPGSSPKLISLEELHDMACAISGDCIELLSEVKISGVSILKTFTQQREELITDLSSIPPLRIISNLKPGSHTYINSDILYDIEMFRMGDRLQYRLDCSHDFEMMLEICYFDSKSTQIARILSPTNQTIRHPIRDEAAFVKFALRIKGPGAAEVYDLFAGNKLIVPATIRNLANHLFVSDSSDLAIVRGLTDTEIFIYTDDLDFDYLKVDSSDVVVGGEWILSSLLRSSAYKSVTFSSRELEEFVTQKSGTKKSANSLGE